MSDCDHLSVLIDSIDQPNGGTTFVDSSANALTLTPYDGIAHSTAQFKFDSSSIEFKKANEQSIGIANNSVIDFGTGDWTIDYWMRFNDPTAATFHGFNTNNSGVNGWQIGYNYSISGGGRTAQTIEVWESPGGTGNSLGAISGTWLPNAGQWYFVRIRQRGGVVSFWIDGVDIGNTGGPSGADLGSSTRDVELGSVILEPSAPLNEFDGFIDGFRAFKGIGLPGALVPLSAFSPTCENVVGSSTKLLMHMDDVGLTDSSTTGHTPTLVGSITRSATEWRFDNYSAYFNGTSQYIRFADSAEWDFGSSDFTVAFWVFHDEAIGTLEDYVNYYNEPGGENFGWFIRRNAAGQLNVLLSSDGTSFDFNQATTETITSGEWHHIAVTRDGNTIRPFIDGKLATFSVTTYANTLTSAPTHLSIGAEYSIASFNYFEGYIDELIISNGEALFTTDFEPPAGAYELITNDAVGVMDALLPSSTGQAQVGITGTGTANALLPSSTGQAQVGITGTGTANALLPAMVGVLEHIPTPMTGTMSALLPLSSGLITIDPVSPCVKMICVKSNRQLFCNVNAESLKTTKNAGAKLDYRLDWAAYISKTAVPEKVITASSWVVPAGLTGSAASFLPTITSIKLEGGTVGETYAIENTVTFGLTNEIDTRTILLTIT